MAVLFARQCVIARSLDFPADVDAIESVDNRSDMPLWVDGVGAELFGKKLLKLIDRQSFDIQSAKAWKVECSIGASKLSAELRNVS